MGELQANADARREILAAIHARLRESAAYDAAHIHPEPHAVAALAMETQNFVTAASLLEVFRERLAAVGGQCRVVKNETEAASALAAIVESCGARRIAITDSPVVERLAAGLDPELVILSQPSAAEQFACDLGVTTAQWAIAESGTLVLESDRERHRLISLVPPIHVAILDVARVRRSMGEVLHAVHHAEGGLSRAITFITGTSRTSDIELTLAIGVHGPAELHVIIIAGGAE